jgi:peroxiredoxin
MATWKSRYVAILLLGQLGLVVVSIAAAWSGRALATQTMCWLVPAVPAGAFLAFMGWLMRARSARTTPGLAALMGPSYASLLVTLGCLAYTGAAAWPAAALTAASVAGNWLYVHWYSRLDRPASSRLKVGELLPSFKVRDLRGEWVDSASWLDRPTVLVFYRGNWCPLCSAQVAEIAIRYQDIEQLGARVALISPQPQRESAALASRFDAPMEFLTDEEGRVGRALGIWHARGVPLGIFGYGSDTVFPTVVVSDARGRVVFCHQTDNYRVRPEPETFIRVLQGLPVRGERDTRGAVA